MIAFVLRGIILVSVLGWYSSGIWKMIDVYFKDRFNKYLKEEYAKNPRIKPGYKSPEVTIDEIVIAVTESNKLLSTPEVNVVDTCPVDISRPSCVPESIESIKVDKLLEGNASDEQKNMSNSPNSKVVKVKKKHKPSPEKKEKLKIKTILLSEDDFKSTRRDDYDFSEFEYDEGVTKPEGIPVDKLPVKPRADIGNLETVTEDEYCPLSLEFEEDCSQTKQWP